MGVKKYCFSSVSHRKQHTLIEILQRITAHLGPADAGQMGRRAFAAGVSRRPQYTSLNRPRFNVSESPLQFQKRLFKNRIRRRGKQERESESNGKSQCKSNDGAVGSYEFVREKIS